MSSTRKKKGASPYFPRKYFSGLSKTRKAERKREIKKFGAKGWKDPAAYKGFQTNVGVKTRSSHYTLNWNRLFPAAKSLTQKEVATGVPKSYIEESYNRGMAAWRTGHRPGATQQQWGYARVHSFLLCGKTHFTTDSDLVRKAKTRSKKAKEWWASRGC
jgi:hypothetical protein